jgi:hypothetical protein
VINNQGDLLIRIVFMLIKVAHEQKFGRGYGNDFDLWVRNDQPMASSTIGSQLDFVHLSGPLSRLLASMRTQFLLGGISSRP